MTSRPTLLIGWLACIVLSIGAMRLLATLRWSWLESVRAHRGARVALDLLVVLCLVALLGPWLAPYDPTQPDPVLLKNHAPMLAHPFGTDRFGRDVLSRIIFGARVTLGLAVVAVMVGTVLATAYGAVAAYASDAVDSIMMRLIDVAISIPRVLVLIVVAALWPHLPLFVLMLLIGATGWFGTSRIVRAQVLAFKATEATTAARALGASGPRILWRHILPNVLSPILVAATLGVGNVILLEASLSYLGLGVQAPTASWGTMLYDVRSDFGVAWWIVLASGAAVIGTTVAVNVVGEGMARGDSRGAA